MAEVKIRDLRDYLAEVEKIGGLKRITQPVDPKLEMSSFAYVNGLVPGHPTLLFENPKGFSNNVSVLFNPIGNSVDRLSLAMRAKPGRTPIQLTEYLKNELVPANKIKPVFVEPKDAPIYENVLEGDQIDLNALPVPNHWPRDGGRYIGTSDAIITEDPETGRINLGTYRQMVHEKNVVGYYSSPGKDTLLDREKWWAMGKPCPVVGVYGLDPLLYICAATGFPKDESEYDYAGALNGEPIEVVKGKHTGLPIPARAELVIEGFSYPKGRPEGPFGEFTGYYGRPGDAATPFIEIKALYFRNKPTLTAALMADLPGCNDQSLFLGLLRGARTWRDLEAVGIPGIKGCFGEPAAAGGFGMMTVSVKQQYAGHAQQAGAIAAQASGGAYYGKLIFVVDEDIDPSDLSQVIWAASTRCKVEEDIDILRRTWSTYLDPSKNPPKTRPWGSKAIIYACKDFRYYEEFARRTALTEEYYSQVAARWTELGFEGAAPKVRAYDVLAEKMYSDTNLVPEFFDRKQSGQV